MSAQRRLLVAVGSTLARTHLHFRRQLQLPRSNNRLPFLDALVYDDEIALRLARFHLAQLKSGVRQDHENVRTVLADLDRAAADVGYLSRGEMARFNHARQEIAEFQSKWERGFFDRHELDDVIGSLQRVVSSNRLRYQDRDILFNDLQRLREIRSRSVYRDRRGYHDRSARDVQDNSRDPRRFVRGEKEGRPRNVLRRAQALEGMGLHECLLHGGRDPLLVAFGEDCFRRNAVGADAIRAGLGSEGLRKELDAGLGNGVRHRGVGARSTGGRR